MFLLGYVLAIRHASATLAPLTLTLQALSYIVRPTSGGSTELRNITLFLALLLVSLTAGRAFWVSLGENPSKISGRSYVELYQVVDRAIEVPIAITGIGDFLFTLPAAFLYRQDRATFFLLLLASALVLVSCLVTIFVSVPINHLRATWNPDALPANYEYCVARWWNWHQVRLAMLLPAMCLLFVATLIRKPPH